MSANYGGPPPPPSMPGSNIPGRRLPTQMPAEAPACVQNAMMTKDKKPFTYTPGGIDLSQIKSPRMARRIERNANSEGVSNTPRPSPLAQPNVQPPTPPVMPAANMGMPVQVFPSGGQPKAPPPPPPPQQQQQKLLNGNKAPTNGDRKSPQTFEPPPFGCRPEIKIPPNPMAILRPVPKPKPKDDFWVEEYRKERSKSPMVQGETGSEATAHESATPPQSSVSPIQTQTPPPPPPTQAPAPAQAQQAFVQQSQVARPVIESPKPAPASPPAPSMAYNQQQSPKTDSPQPVFAKPEISEKPAFLMHQHQQQHTPLYQRRVSPVRSPSPAPQRQQQQQQQPQPQQQQDQQPRRPPPNRWNAPAPTQAQEEPKPLTVFNNVKPTPVNSPPTQATQSPNTTNGRVHNETKPAQVGSLYIPPVEPQDMYSNKGNTQPTQVTPPNWMQTRQTPGREVPEWANREPNGIQYAPKPQSTQQVYQDAVIQQQQQPPRVIYQQQPVQSRPVQQQQQTVQYTNQSNTQQETTTTHRERIIPIQLEQTPTPTKCPTSPGFGPQPFYNLGQQQYSSVQSPGGTVYHNNSPSITPTIHHNPNQFVDQGYSNFGPERAFNGARGPIAQQPTILQRDPNSDQGWGNSTPPNQSKSFRILQKITDTIDFLDKEAELYAPEAQPPQFARQMDYNEQQLRRMQLNDQEAVATNLRGPMVGDGLSSGRMPQQANPMYQQRAHPDGDVNNFTQYVHPSEQQAPEPKKYTGSAIPSRSFKMLQAMTATTPENAANDDDDGDGHQNSSTLTHTNPYDNHTSYSCPSPKYSSDSLALYATNNDRYYSLPQQRLSSDKLLPRTPSIVVTPTPDDENQQPFVLSESASEVDPFKSLSKKLANYSCPENENHSRAYQKVYMGDDNKFEGESEEEDDDEEEESSESSSMTEEEEEEAEQEVQGNYENGLKSIRSVTDIKVYQEPTPDEYLVEEGETEDSDLDDEDQVTVDEVNEHDPHELSVILEESDKTKSNNRSRSASSTDCSTTLANDESEEEDQSDDKDSDGDADVENSVTVRLPLKLSFSRSLDNEEITTVVVGNSETKEKSGSDSFERPVLKLQPTVSDADVSVSFNVPSRSSSISRTNYQDSNEVSDAEDEVSVSVSLPMMRNKFSHQSMSLDTENQDIESLASDSDCEDIVEIEIEVPDAEIDDIWGEGSPELRRKPLIYQAVPEETEDETLTEDSDTTETSSEEELVEEKKPAIVQEIKKQAPEPKYKPHQLVKCEILFKTNYLQLHPYHSMVEHLTTPPQVAEISYQEPPPPPPAPTTYDRNERCRGVTPLRAVTPQLSTSRPSQSEMESIHNRLRCITPIRSLTPTRSTTPVMEQPLSRSASKENEEKLNVRQRIAVFERIKSQDFSAESPRPMSPLALHSYSNTSTPRHSFIAANEESADEDDSGVPSEDNSRQISDSECENFPELRKMTKYQRAATHSRLFKLLQEEGDEEPEPEPVTNKKVYNPKKIVHNVSITRKTNPNAMKEVETLEQRRERLSLPLGNNRSLDQDSNPSSSSVSSVSPTNQVSDKLLDELVQSFMKKQKHKLLRNVSMERIHAAARRALQQDDTEFDSAVGSSRDVSTVSSTPAITPQEFKNGYSDYYESFNRSNNDSDGDLSSQNSRSSSTELLGQKRLWGIKCPRVLSSKTVNRDLSLIRESESPEPISFRRSITPHSQSPGPTTNRFNPIYRHSYHN